MKVKEKRNRNNNRKGVVVMYSSVFVENKTNEFSGSGGSAT